MGEMSVALHGHDDDPDDPTLISLSMPVDEAVLPGPLAQARVEDMQAWAALSAMAVHDLLHHPVALLPDDDPPDRRIVVAGREYSVELTTLTAQDVRAELSRLRLIARQIHLGIAGGDAYQHLDGRLVSVVPADAVIPEITSGLVPAVLHALREDKGTVGEDLDLSQGLPEQIPAGSAGFYGQVADLILQVYPNDRPGTAVHGTCQMSTRLSEVREGLAARVRAKDDARNQILICTTGLLDNAGYRCPHDVWLFHWLRDMGPKALPAPEFLDAVILHQFGTNDLHLVYERPSAHLPWHDV